MFRRVLENYIVCSKQLRYEKIELNKVFFIVISYKIKFMSEIFVYSISIIYICYIYIYYIFFEYNGIFS